MDTKILKNQIIELHQKRSVNRPFVIGIDGLSGAGKTTLAETLAELLGNTTVIHTDDVFLPMPDYKKLTLDPIKVFEKYCDWKRLRDQVLIPLSKNQPSKLQTYDWGSNSLERYIPIKPSRFLIIEGTSAYRPELINYFDFTIFVKTNEKLRSKRILEREGAAGMEIFNRCWSPAQDWYMKQYYPEKIADFIFD